MTNHYQHLHIERNADRRNPALFARLINNSQQEHMGAVIVGFCFDHDTTTILKLKSNQLIKRVEYDEDSEDLEITTADSKTIKVTAYPAVPRGCKVHLKIVRYDNTTVHVDIQYSQATSSILWVSIRHTFVNVGERTWTIN